MYHLLIRRSDPDYTSKGRSADYCIYGNGYRPDWWGYTIEEAVHYYNFTRGSSCTGTIEECIIKGGNHIIHVLPFEVLDADHIINHYPELFI